MSQVHTLYFVHHSHTDIGYTHDQPIVFDLHCRFLDEALALVDKYASQDSDGTFRWTVETTYVFSRWLEQASPQQIERFQTLERAGRIEVTGMFANLTPLCDTDQLIETFQLLRSLREDYGFTIQSAMNCDVNGENWPLVDLLLDLGIEGFSMAINTHFGGAPMQRPNVFWWQGPSGRKILAYNGWPYDTGWRYGIGHDAALFEQTWWPRVERRLEEIHYPLPVLMVQSFHPFGDNGPAYEEFSRFIDAWNAEGKSPRLVLATPRSWWAAVKEHSHHLPTFRGDWTDYWNFGCISSAREQAINRASRARLRAADILAAAVLGTADPQETRVAKSFRAYRDKAWHALHLFDEHTWGADCSIRAPGSEDTAAQWHHKASYAYTARSLSLLLQRDALAELAQRVERAQPDDMLVFNPLPWPRLIAGEVPSTVTSPRGKPEDVTSGRHSQDRNPDEDDLPVLETIPGQPAPKSLWLKPVEVPGLGYTVIPRADLVEWTPTWQFREDEVVENAFFRLAFDRQRGGITSCYDKRLSREWVDRQTGVVFNGFVSERMADSSHPWPRNLFFHMEWASDQVERPRGWKPGWHFERNQPGRVRSHRVFCTPLGLRVVQTLEAPGCAGLLTQSVFLPDHEAFIECEAWWDMGLQAHPEATYLAFPFDVPAAVARLDLGGQAIIAGADQLPGVCRDYYTAQGWVDFSNPELGVSVALPDNPMLQLGDFHFAHNQESFHLERPLLLGWVTNNYWETNFRAHQPGRVQARYRLSPHAGGFSEARAHRFGLEAAYTQPLLQHLGEPVGGHPMLPRAGSLLRLPESDNPTSPVLTLHLKPAERLPGVVLRLLNASDQEHRAEIGSGLLRIKEAWACDLLERARQSLAVQDGSLAVSLSPRQVVAVLLSVEI